MRAFMALPRRLQGERLKHPPLEFLAMGRRPSTQELQPNADGEALDLSDSTPELFSTVIDSLQDTLSLKGPVT